MVNISSLNKGDKINIVSQWSNDGLENQEGLMDRYLAQTLTVSRVCKSGFQDYVTVEEDDGKWAWFASMIESVSPPLCDNEPGAYCEVSDEDFASLFST